MEINTNINFFGPRGTTSGVSNLLVINNLEIM